MMTLFRVTPGKYITLSKNADITRLKRLQLEIGRNSDTKADTYTKFTLIQIAINRVCCYTGRIVTKFLPHNAFFATFLPIRVSKRRFLGGDNFVIIFICDTKLCC